MPTHYEVLGVAPNADPETIETAYKQLVRKYHPDINPSPQATEWMQTINVAYTVLKNPTKRRIYDAELGQRRPFSTSNDPHTLFLEVWHENHPVVQLTPWFPVAGRYQVDFALPSHKLAIEVDAETGDPDRWAMLDAAGWQVIAFNREHVLRDPQECVETAYATLGHATLKAEDPVGYAKTMREQEELEELYRQYTTSLNDEKPALQWAPLDRHSALYGACCTVIGLSIGVMRSNVRYTEMTSTVWIAWWSIAILGAMIGGALAAFMRRRGIRWMPRLHQILAGLTVLASVMIIIFSHLTVMGWVTILIILGIGTVAGLGVSSLLGGWLDGRIGQR